MSEVSHGEHAVAVAEQIPHEAHQEYFVARAEQLRNFYTVKLDHEGDLHHTTQNISTYEQEEHEEGESEPSLEIKQQIELVAGYYAAASSSLGKEAVEDDVWREVFNLQVKDLDKHKESGNAYAYHLLATNVLISEKLSLYGEPMERTEQVIGQNMWRLAKAGHGPAISRAAEVGQGYCVLTGQEDKPYESIREDVNGYVQLLDIGARDDYITVRFHKLAAAPPEDQSWYLNNLLAKEGSAYPVLKQLEFASPEACKEILPKIVDTIPGDDYSELRAVKTARLGESSTPEVEAVLLEALLQKKGMAAAIDRLDNLKYDTAKISGRLFDTFKDGAGGNMLVYAALFDEVPEGTMQIILEQNEDIQYSHGLDRSLGAFTSSDRRLLYEHCMTGEKVGVIVRNMASFEFADKQAVLDLAISQNMWDLPSYIEQFTDGSDTELLKKILDNPSYTSRLTDLISLPNTDKLALYKYLREKEDYYTILDAVQEFGEFIDQETLFREVVENNVFSLGGIVNKFDRIDKNAALEFLFRGEHFYVIARNANNFDIPSQQIFDRLCQTGEGFDTAIDYLSEFKQLDVQALLQTLKDKDKLSYVAAMANYFVEEYGFSVEWAKDYIFADKESLSMFLGRPHTNRSIIDEIGVETLIEEAMKLSASSSMAFFMSEVKTNLPLTELWLRHAVAEKGHSNSYSIAEAIKKLELDPKLMMDICLQAGNVQILEDVWHKSTDPFETQKDFAEKLKDAGHIFSAEDLVKMGANSVVLLNLDQFPGAQPNQIFAQLVAEGEAETVIRVMSNDEALEKITKWPTALIPILINDKSTQAIGLYFDRFDFATDPIDEDIMLKMLNADVPSVHRAYAVSRQDSGVGRLGWYEQTVKQLGEGAPSFAYVAARDVVKAESTSELLDSYRAAGISAVGQEGLKQLDSIIDELREGLVDVARTGQLSPEFAKQLLENDLLGMLAKNLVRFNQSEWGEQTEDEWSRIIKSALENQAEADLSPGLKESSVINIKKQGFVETTEVQITEDVQNKFNILKRAISQAIAINSMAPTDRLDILGEGLVILRSELERFTELRAEKAAQNAHPKALESLDERIETIKSLSELSGKEFVRYVSGNFEAIMRLGSPKLEEVALTTLISRELRRESRRTNANQVGSVLQAAKSVALGSDGPSLTKLREAEMVIDHITNQAVSRQYFSTDAALKAFKTLTNTRALREQLVRAEQSVESVGRVRMQFLPTRGLMLELSGHIADACWASKYESIALEYPNVTAITMLRNPGEESERFVGSALLIESLDRNTGEPVVVIRGINPIQRFVGQVDTGDFMTQLLEYVRSVSANRRVAIAVDEYSGGATSNRPEIVEWLQQNYPNPKELSPLNLPNSSTFNGYRLSPAANHPVVYV